MDEQQQRLVDTKELKQIVADVVEAAVDRRLSDHPTRSEVADMISGSIDRLEARIASDRKAQMDSLEKLLDSTIGGIKSSLDTFVRQYETRHGELQNDLNESEKKLTGYTETQTMLITTTNRLNDVVFGIPGASGSLPALIQDQTRAINLLAEKFEPRIAALERAEAWRTAIAQRVLRLGNFFTTRGGIGLIAFLFISFFMLIGRVDIAAAIQSFFSTWFPISDVGGN